MFTIDKIQPTTPITYKLKDLNKEPIDRSFYEQELQKTTQEVFRVEKVLRRDYKKKLAFVKWKGYPSVFNSWIPITDVKKYITRWEIPYCTTPDVFNVKVIYISSPLWYIICKHMMYGDDLGAQLQQRLGNLSKTVEDGDVGKQ